MDYDMLENLINKISNEEFDKVLEIDKEFEKYNKLFKDKFGRDAYIAEPSGTKEQTIEAIKKCLKEDKDILDEILYPNNDVIY